MKDYFEEPQKKRIKKRKVVIVGIIILLIILAISIVVIYHKNIEVREWIDIYIFRKEIMQDNLSKIELVDIEDSNIYAYSRYIGVLNRNKFDIYTSLGNKEITLDMQVQKPIFNSTNRFLVIAEDRGQKFYVIEDQKMIWESSVEGNISQIYVNENGYVGIIVTGTSSESVIIIYDSDGDLLFKTYLSSTKAISMSISKDNKFLAIGEVDISGTVVQSSIKIISIDTAIKTPEDAIKKTYKSEMGRLIINLEYQNKNKLVCMYDDVITVIENEQESIISDNNDKKISYKSIELNNSVVYVQEKLSGLFTADSYVNFIDLENMDKKEYIIDSSVKELYSKGNSIAINLGTQIEFVNRQGGLVKRYIANQEVTNISLSENLAAIVYMDKIEIVNL